MQTPSTPSHVDLPTSHVLSASSVAVAPNLPASSEHDLAGRRRASQPENHMHAPVATSGATPVQTEKPFGAAGPSALPSADRTTRRAARSHSPQTLVHQHAADQQPQPAEPYDTRGVSAQAAALAEAEATRSATEEVRAPVPAARVVAGAGVDAAGIVKEAAEQARVVPGTPAVAKAVHTPAPSTVNIGRGAKELTSPDEGVPKCVPILSSGPWSQALSSGSTMYAHAQGSAAHMGAVCEPV